jgi:hypothetical protein
MRRAIPGGSFGIKDASPEHPCFVDVVLPQDHEAMAANRSFDLLADPQFGGR